jgi:ATP-dependent helicase/nuclease subunit B
MQAFLEEVAEHILKQYPEETGSICLVTPNRRAGLFFRKHFALRVTKTMWAPEVISIEDFINRLSGLTICDQLSLLLTFYELHKEEEKEKARSLDDFIQWAPTLLKDFDDIDASLQQPQELFQLLQETNRIKTWNPDGSPPTHFQKEYLAFFSQFSRYYLRLKSTLLAGKQAYQGLSSRIAAEMAEKNTLKLPWKRVIFIGFNALTQAEETIADNLIKKGLAEYITDSDPYYVEDTDHEAGLFIRKYISKWPAQKTHSYHRHYADSKKSIHVLGIAKNVNQARLAGNILDQHPHISTDEKTALVLANESLLIPALNALPGKAEHINITMGYPLDKTNMFGFFDALFQLFVNAEKALPEGGSQHPAFYYKDLFRLFQHASATLLWESGNGEKQNSLITQKLLQAKLTFYRAKDLLSLVDQKQEFQKTFSFLLREEKASVDKLAGDLSELTALLDIRLREKARLSGGEIINTPYFVDFESLWYFAGVFRRLQAFTTKAGDEVSLLSIYRLFKQLAGETRLSFAGEPLKGLQLMGMLETRNLDFENIILLSANENILPKAKNNRSFIPYDIRKEFGLPVHGDRDATYAYHFYRLLQRAKNVFIIYNTQTEDFGNNEKSRFVTQLQMELGTYNPLIDIQEEVVSLPPPPGQQLRPWVIEKTDSIRERLQQMAQSGFSPSALGKYINCPLQFYLSAVARIREPEKVEEVIEASTMGTVIHNTLEEIYTPYVGQSLSASIIDILLSQAEQSIRKNFEQVYPSGDISSGKNLLIFHLVQRYVERFLQNEKEQLRQWQEQGSKLKLLALEEMLQASVSVITEGKQMTVKVKGKADRIDSIDGVIRIIDYKTGRADSKELAFDEWEDLISDSKNAKSFQLLTYAWLYGQVNEQAMYIQPGIASMRSAEGHLLTLHTPEKEEVIQRKQLKVFEDQLAHLIRDIMDPNLPFTQTSDEDNCRFCSFRAFCHRLTEGKRG